MTKRNATYLLIFVVIATFMTSCAPDGYEPNESGFFSGIWHGFIIVFSLIGKLFGADIGYHRNRWFWWRRICSKKIKNTHNKQYYYLSFYLICHMANFIRSFCILVCFGYFISTFFQNSSWQSIMECY